MVEHFFLLVWSKKTTTHKFGKFSNEKKIQTYLIVEPISISKSGPPKILVTGSVRVYMFVMYVILCHRVHSYLLNEREKNEREKRGEKWIEKKIAHTKKSEKLPKRNAKASESQSEKLFQRGRKNKKKKKEHIWRWHTIVKQHIRSKFFFIPNRTKPLLYVFLFFRIEQKNFFFRSEILSHFSFFFLCCFCCVLQYCLWFKSKMKKIKKTVHARTNTHSLAIARARTHRPRHTHQREEKSFKVAIMQKTFVLNYLAFCQQFR